MSVFSPKHEGLLLKTRGDFPLKHGVLLPKTRGCFSPKHRVFLPKTRGTSPQNTGGLLLKHGTPHVPRPCSGGAVLRKPPGACTDAAARRRTCGGGCRGLAGGLHTLPACEVHRVRAAQRCVGSCWPVGCAGTRIGMREWGTDPTGTVVERVTQHSTVLHI